MRNKFKIGIKQCECRCAKNSVSRANAILAQRVAPVRPCLWWADQGHVVTERFDRRLRALESIAGPTASRSIRIHRVLSSNENISRLMIRRHATQPTSGIIQYARRLTLSAPRDNQREDPACRRDVQHSNRSFLRFEARNRLLGLENNALTRAAVVNQVTTDNRHRPVRESNRHLREIVDSGKCRNLIQC